MKWGYDYLLSCPSMLRLGYPSVHGMTGVVLMTLMYPRLNILSRNKEFRILGGIPRFFMGDAVDRLCRGIARGVVKPKGFIEEAVYNTLFLGGVNLYLNYRGKTVLVDTEYVDSSSIAMYYRLGETSIQGFPSRGLDDWILLLTGLREGDTGLILTACRGLGRVVNGGCSILSGNMELLITRRDSQPPRGYLRIIPDNNGLRNVVQVDQNNN